MSKVKRAQFSIIFNDSDLYDQFIEPLKMSKELSTLVSKLLTCYYYNDEVRNAVDGCSTEVDITSNTKALDLISYAKDNLLMLGACINSAQGSVEEGIKIMQGYSEQFDTTPNTSSSFGKPILQLDLPKPDISEQPTSSDKQAESGVIDAKVTKLENDISDIRSLLQTIALGMKADTTQFIENEVVETVLEKSSTLIQKDESSLSNNNLQEDLQNQKERPMSTPVVSSDTHEVSIQKQDVSKLEESPKTEIITEVDKHEELVKEVDKPKDTSTEDTQDGSIALSALINSLNM